jgi:hypothetical protein
MKNIMLTILFLMCSNLWAEAAKPEKTLILKNHIVRMSLQPNKMYRLELRESAAAYQAEEKLAPCLEKAIKENSIAELTVTAYSLKVVDCKNK